MVRKSKKGSGTAYPNERENTVIVLRLDVIKEREFVAANPAAEGCQAKRKTSKGCVHYP
jgi:hypothetical protein